MVRISLAASNPEGREMVAVVPYTIGARPPVPAAKRDYNGEKVPESLPSQILQVVVVVRPLEAHGRDVGRGL